MVLLVGHSDDERKKRDLGAESGKVVGCFEDGQSFSFSFS
jgi:hypothetical protein